MVTGLVLQGLLSYTVQSAGQLMTAHIRSDLFDHALGLNLRFHVRTPVGLLLTRLTRVRTHHVRNDPLSKEGRPREQQEEG